MLGWSLWRIDQGRSLIPFCNPYTQLSHCRHWRRLRLEDEEALQDLLEQRPALILYCGGICDVEKCERNPSWAWQINVGAVEKLLRLLPESTRLVYCSSDHVFGGERGPYLESSSPDPISVYGKTRVAAERLVSERGGKTLILRLGLPIGPSIDGKSGHLDWLRYRTQRNLPITVVEDESRSVAWSCDLAERVLAFAESPICGIRHVVSSRCVGRLELATYLNQRFGLNATLRVGKRKERKFPHLGRVDLQTEWNDALACPLPDVLD